MALLTNADSILVQWREFSRREGNIPASLSQVKTMLTPSQHGCQELIWGSSGKDFLLMVRPMHAFIGLGAHRYIATTVKSLHTSLLRFTVCPGQSD